MDAAYCTPERFWKEIIADEIEFSSRDRPSVRFALARPFERLRCHHPLARSREKRLLVLAIT